MGGKRKKRSHAPDGLHGDQKKSVFDRLGRQMDPGRLMGRRSPMAGQHPMMPPMLPNIPPDHEFGPRSFGRGGEMHPNMVDQWRYQNELRRQQHMPLPRDRHMHLHLGHPPMHAPLQPPIPPHQMPHYNPEIELSPGSGGRPSQMSPYYPHGHPYAQPGLPPPLGPPQTMDGLPPMSISMHNQRRPSPKYDRHGNLIRGMPMHMHALSPPRNYLHQGSGNGPMSQAELVMYGEMRPGNNAPMFAQRWPGDGPSMGPLGPIQSPGMPMPHMMHDDQSFMEPPRYHMGKPMLFNAGAINPPMAHQDMNGMPQDVPRYIKWRERRDVITNLDRQTAQSSSKTDSLKSSLQQQTDSKSKRLLDQQSTSSSLSSATLKTSNNLLRKNTHSDSAKKDKAEKVNPQDISDGEIVDDESSDDDDEMKEKDETNVASRVDMDRNPYNIRHLHHDGSYGTFKRRRGDQDLDYETISDEELDDFMSEKQAEDGRSAQAAKSSSEVELLNALGLDWANLVEMSKQTKKETGSANRSALRRFSLANYLPTLGITKELAGPRIYELVTKVCHC